MRILIPSKLRCYARHLAILIFGLVTLPLGSASVMAADQNGKGKPGAPQKESLKAEKSVPKTLDEAHIELERIFSKAELAKIDAMKSEDDMIEYHFSLGMGLRNDWGLWSGDSLLAKQMRTLGFSHPDDISGVILSTLWCKRHGKPFRLEERASYYKAYWKAAADPPKSARDPKDSSKITWSMSFGTGDGEKPRQIHIGKSQKTGRWLAYEYDKGVYVPDEELMKRINADPFATAK